MDTIFYRIIQQNIIPASFFLSFVNNGFYVAMVIGLLYAIWLIGITFMVFFNTVAIVFAFFILLKVFITDKKEENKELRTLLLDILKLSRPIFIILSLYFAVSVALDQMQVTNIGKFFFEFLFFTGQTFLTFVMLLFSYSAYKIMKTIQQKR